MKRKETKRKKIKTYFGKPRNEVTKWWGKTERKQDAHYCKYNENSEGGVVVKPLACGARGSYKICLNKLCEILKIKFSIIGDIKKHYKINI